jgi:RHS repeat-associated protein
VIWPTAAASTAPPTYVEQYSYDADGERLSRTHDGLTTFYLAGLLEADVQSGVVVATRTLYALQGQVVATRTPGGLFYLHGDHLGSVALSVNATTGATSSQEFDPWGAVRTGSVPQTSLNYTGQRKDGTGLLYYHARYYDPALARWTSPDSIVPGTAQLRALTVDFHQNPLLRAVNTENAVIEREGFWFQLDGQEQENTGSPRGPTNAQMLNRYAYGANSPMTFTDPTGYFHCRTPGCGGVVTNQSAEPVWVFGVIYVGPGSNVDPSHLQSDPNFPMQRIGPDPEHPSDCPGARCDYIQGWFLLPPGTASDTYLGMGDADAVRGFDPNRPLYDVWDKPHSSDGSVEFKFSSFIRVAIGDAHGRQVLAFGPKPSTGVSMGWWVIEQLAGQSTGHFGGWVRCAGNSCVKNPTIVGWFRWG